MDLLPDEAQDDVLWAVAQLNQRRRTQGDILAEFNERLAGKGVDPISPSAFQRRAARLAAMQKRLSEARHVFAGLADQFAPGAIDESNIALGEMIKMLILELLDEPTASPKQAMELANALRSIVQTQKVSAERRQALEAEAARQAAKAVEAVGQARGLTAATVEEIKARILGVTKSAGDGTA
ncbi:phage protein Gp27 family protein [Segnochrobactrum spirostomi]|uniref:DUF3486 family protein n=1 Tax=Segnochrobactrum spirostomi TaxID=2608987 RepID=A0A6A7Y3G4_9HYPH|nr:phage protein Gp27 family protein [Segnochrobactrum spirostomi]MQT13654.1 DUF3486 family protein [Segnochrobactrum spirostomi]